MDIHFSYCVKDAYAAANASLSSAAIEYTLTVERRYITADPANSTFEVGEVVQEHEPYTEMKTMTNIAISADSRRYGFNFYDPRLAEFNEGYTRAYTYYSFDKVLRITGTLYIYNGNAA